MMAVLYSVGSRGEGVEEGQLNLEGIDDEEIDKVCTHTHTHAQLNVYPVIVYSYQFHLYNDNYCYYRCCCQRKRRR